MLAQASKSPGKWPMIDQDDSDCSTDSEPPGIANPLLGVGVLLLMLLPIVGWYGYGWVRANNLASYGLQAPGRLESFQTLDGHGVLSGSSASYTFSVNGQTYRGRSAWGSGISPFPQEGESISVTYDRENPNVNSWDPQADIDHAEKVIGYSLAGTCGVFLLLLTKLKRT